MGYDETWLMVEILTQKQARKARNLDFCFQCGEPFDDDRRPNHPDHLPPRKLFAEDDRDFPIKVAAHLECNNRFSDQDEIVAQLVAVTHGQYPNPERVRLHSEVIEDQNSGQTRVGVGGTDVERHVIRWVRGFHAALYGEFVPPEPETRFCVSLPFPRFLGGPRGRKAAEQLLQNHLDFVAEIKKQRMAGRLDRIECNNGQCVYECVWTTSDEGKPVCIFALKVYDWKQLADPALSRDSCVGLYEPSTGRPSLGTEATNLEMPVPNLQRLDAFG